MARKAKAENTIVSIDVDNVFEGIDELLPLVDIMISSAEFPAKLVGIEDSRTALREINRRFGCPIVGLTLGEKGSLMLCEDEFIQSKGFDVPNGCKDTTGAGDAFRAGFLHGLLNGETIESAAQKANAVAALKCRQLGARTALPTDSEVIELIKKV